MNRSQFGHSYERLFEFFNDTENREQGCSQATEASVKLGKDFEEIQKSEAL